MPTETLNDRQKTYLLTIFRLDQLREADQRGAWNRGQRVLPAAAWRWIAYNTSESMLRWQLLEAHLVDEGTGSTFESLERRGLIACRDARDPLGVPILFVQMTSKGRRLARSLTGERRERPLPTGTLRAWHWKALVVAYLAGNEGVKQEYAFSGRYGGIGWNTWLRLRDYQHQGKEQPLIREASTWVQVQRSVFTGRPRPNDYEERTVAEQEHRLSITAFGQSYYVQHWQHYRQLYPEIEAPEPGKESEVRHEP
jgi:hypothetical protein